MGHLKVDQYSDFSNRVILKNLIRSMFAAVWGGEKDEVGNREIVFELKSGEYSEFLLEEGDRGGNGVAFDPVDKRLHDTIFATANLTC